MIRNFNVNDPFLRNSIWKACNNTINDCRNTTTAYARLGQEISCFKLKKSQKFLVFLYFIWSNIPNWSTAILKNIVFKYRFMVKSPFFQVALHPFNLPCCFVNDRGEFLNKGRPQ